jgi:hypothetical protein
VSVVNKTNALLGQEWWFLLRSVFLSKTDGLISEAVQGPKCAFQTRFAVRQHSEWPERLRLTRCFPHDKQVVSEEIIEGYPLFELGFELSPDTTADSKEEAEVLMAAAYQSTVLHEIYRFWERSELESELGLPPCAEDPEAFSMWLATWLLQSHDNLGAALETRSTTERLRMCESTLLQVHEHLVKKAEEDATAAGTDAPPHNS